MAISVLWEGISVGGEAHRPYVPKNDRITWPEVGRRFFKTEPDYAYLRGFGFPQGRQSLGHGNGAPLPPMTFKLREIEEWVEQLHNVAANTK